MTGFEVRTTGIESDALPLPIRTFLFTYRIFVLCTSMTEASIGISSVTKWLECLFNILPFKTMKMGAQLHLKFDKLTQNYAKY